MNDSKPTSERPGDRFKAALEKHLKNEDPIIADQCAHELLMDALNSRASDIHLDPHQDKQRVRFRVDGSLLEIAKLDAEPGARLIRFFKTNSGLDPGTQIGPKDGHYEFDLDGETIDVRVSVAPCLNGEKASLRLLPRSRLQIDLDDLGLGDEEFSKITDWVNHTTGMFLVAGPTGCGKTTTLHALLRHMDLNARSVLSIEDPVEYRNNEISQIQVDPSRELTLASGLRAALRLDPDFILLGEIRDSESAKIGLEAAGTGHTMLTTLHSRSAAGAVTMLRNLGLTDHEIAASLTIIVTQRLVRKLCPHCKVKGKPDKADERWLSRMGMDKVKTAWQAKGCEKCHDIGYHGRTGVFEVCPFDEPAYDLVLSGCDEAKLREHFRESGARSLFHDGMEKVREGITTIAEVRALGAKNNY